MNDGAWFQIVVSIYVVMSGLTLLVYAADKVAAKNGWQRTPEFRLHLLALFCGWPGALIGQRVFRHKTSKKAFQQVFWVMVVGNVGVAGYLIWFFRAYQLPV